MATQGLLHTRIQNPGHVHDPENARETGFGEVRSGVPSGAVPPSIRSVPIQPSIPSVATQSSVLTADAHRIAISTDERTNLARICASDYVTIFTNVICRPHYCTRRRMLVGPELTVACL